MKPKKDLMYPILDEIASRWSGRAFSNKELKKETLLQLFEAARWAPSSYNEQPWCFIVGMKGSENFKKLYDSLMSGNQEWAGNAGALILTIAIKELERNGKPNKFAQYDLGQSVAYLTLEAEKMNLNVHQMGGFDTKQASEAFGIENPFEAMSVIAIGNRGEADSLSESLKTKEISRQSRKELEQKVFFEKFNIKK